MFILPKIIIINIYTQKASYTLKTANYS